MSRMISNDMNELKKTAVSIFKYVLFLSHLNVVAISSVSIFSVR